MDPCLAMNAVNSNDQGRHRQGGEREREREENFPWLLF